MLLSRIRANISNFTRNQPIHTAANNPNCSLGVFKNILENAVDIDSKNNDGNTPLILAIKCAHKLPIIKLLLQWKASVNQTDDYGQSPLHYAVSFKSIESSPKHPKYELKVIKLLLYYGAEINMRNNEGSTPLLCAVSKNNSRVDVINLLLKRDANILLMDHQGYQPLHSAVSNPNCNLEVVEMLLDRGASVNDTTDDDENYPLHCAVQSSDCKVEILQLLLKRGSDVNARNQAEGKSPLQMALENSCQLKIIKLLLDSKADINATCDIGKSALYYALRNSNCSLSICKMLLHHGAKVNVSTRFGETPLQYVLSKCPPQFDCIRLLLENGVYVNTRNEIGEFPLQQFTRYNYSSRDENTLECLKLLIKYTLLHNIDFDIQSCIREWDNAELFAFRWKCEDELHRIYSNDLSIFEILTGKRQLKFDTLAPTENSIRDVMRILKNLGEKEYPFYTDIISSKLKRKVSVSMLEAHQITTTCDEKTLSLDFFSACNIGEYLCNKDLLNAVLAFQKESYSAPKTKFLNISKLDYKLGERFIDDPVKAYIARIKNF